MRRSRHHTQTTETHRQNRGRGPTSDRLPTTGHVLRSQWRAFTHRRTHVSKADTIIYRSSQLRLRDLPDEGALLSEHTDSEDRSQRP